MRANQAARALAGDSSEAVRKGSVAGRVPAGGASVMQTSREDRLKRAKEYPYKRPSSSFLFVNGKPYTFPDSTWTSVENIRELTVRGDDGSQQSVSALFDSLGIANECAPRNRDEWTPVLAIASNAGPEQLARKLPPSIFPQGVVVPVVRGVLTDFDVVYSPLISTYGSCPGTLTYSPGGTFEVFVSYFTEPISKRMDETEGGYYVSELKNIDLQLGTSLDIWRETGKGAQKLDSIIQYNQQNGVLHIPISNGTASPIALTTIPAHNRTFPALSEEEMLSLLHKTFSNGGTNGAAQESTDLSSAEDDLDSWILRNVDDLTARRELIDKLIELAKPFPYKHCTNLRLLEDRSRNPVF